MGFDNTQKAARMRDVIRALSRREIESMRPSPGYGTVVAVDYPSRQAQIEFPDGTTTIFASNDWNLVAGTVVRIEGASGDRYIGGVAQGNALSRTALAPVIWSPAWLSTVGTNPDVGAAGADDSSWQVIDGKVFAHMELTLGSDHVRGGNGQWSFTLPVNAEPDRMFTGTGVVLNHTVAWSGGWTSMIDGRSAGTGNDQLVMISYGGTGFLGANYPTAFATPYVAGSKIIADIVYRPDPDLGL